MLYTPQQAAQRALDRRNMRQSLRAWSTHRRSKYGQTPAAHHLLLLDSIQAAVDGNLTHPDTKAPCSNLIFLLPPGSAKSTYLSVDAVPWVMQRKQGWRVLACSHKAELIQSFSYECRNCVAEEYETLGFALRSDSKSVQEWDATNGSSYFCSGVGSGLSGRRAYFGAIDDYIGSDEDANSKLVRDKQWHWYWHDFFPRLTPNAIQIIVANRQHEDDLVGRLLERQADQWVVIKIPFFAEENDPLKRSVGESLWPEWFTEKKVGQIRDLQRLDPRTYAGLYQQRPAPEEGSYFKKDMLRTYTQDEYDKLMRLNPRIYIGCDFAVSEEKDANRCAFVPVAVAPDGLLYVLPDLFWKQAGSEESTRAWLDLMKRRSPQVVWAEKGHISKSIGPFLKQMMIDEHTYAYIEEVTPVRAKDVRARSIQAMMAIGRVRFPSFASWWTAAEHELLTFPGGKTDDFVDALAYIGLGLKSLIRASYPQKETVEDLSQPFVPTVKWLREQHKLNKPKEAAYQGR